MQAKLISMLLSTLLGLLTPELLKDVADFILDFCEDKVLGTKSEIDDKLVLPVCKLIRVTFDIPDEDD